MSLSLDSETMKLRKAVMEIRYDDAYLLWDKSGIIWSEMSKIWSGLKNSKAEPNNTTFYADDRYELSIQINKAHFIDRKSPKSLKDFKKNADLFVKKVSEFLDIEEYTRLGFRLIFTKNYNNVLIASENLLSTNLFKIPSGKHFNIDGNVTMPSYSIRWEGDSAGLRVILRVNENKVNLDIHPDIYEIEPVNITRCELIYDLDYYTLKKTKRGQLNVDEWISQVYHAIKRDSKFFLGE